MATVAEMVANVRKSWLRNPLPQRPTVEQLYEAVFTEIQHCYNKLSNTGKPWALGTATISIPALPSSTGIGDAFPVNLPTNCGKVLQITAQVSGLEYLPTIFAPELVNVGDLFTSVPIGSWHWYGGGAERIGLYQQNDGVWYARVVGYTTVARSYDVLYTIGDWVSEAGIETSPILREHHHLIEARAAFAVLDEAAWSNDEDKNDAKRKGRLATLMPLIKDYQAAFDEYILSLRTPKVVTVSSGVDY